MSILHESHPLGKRSLGTLMPSFAVGLLLAAVSPTALKAQVVEHQGANNPTSEGWSEFSTGGVTAGPVINDLGLGVDSWFVNDNDNSGARYYEFVPSSATVDCASEKGWTLSTEIRMVEFPDPPAGQSRPLEEDASPVMLYRDGSREWSIHFGAENDGDVIAMLMTKVTPVGEREGTAIVISGGTAEYRAFDLAYDPLTDTAELFVDGISAYTGYPGAPFDTSAIVSWGARTTPAKGRANFASVRYDIAPRPVPAVSDVGLAALAVWLIGTVVVLLRGRSAR